jgi:COMPASS component SWD1
VSILGLVHIWVTGVTENWSAYAPGFDELDENVEYREREDEFDYVGGPAGPALPKAIF